MTTEDLLWEGWGIWLSYFVSEQEQKTIDYSKTLKKVHDIVSHQDLIALWAFSPLNDTKNFFVRQGEEPNKNIWPTYVIDEKQQRINAINFFRKDIKPSWEDPLNAQGARLFFQVDKNSADPQKVYEWIVFYFLGESQENNEQINGIRFISPKPNASSNFHYRVQVWVRFRQCDMQKVKSLKQKFMISFVQSFNVKNFKPQFRDNKKTE